MKQIIPHTWKSIFRMDGVLDSQDVSCNFAKALPLRSVEIVLHVKAKTIFFRNTSLMPPKMVKCEVLHSRVALADTVAVPSSDHLAVSSFQNAHLAAGSDTSKVKCKGLTKSLTSTLLPSALQKLMLTDSDDKTAAFPTTASVSKLLLSDEGSATALSSRGSLLSTPAVARISATVPAATITSAMAIVVPPGTRIRRVRVSRSLTCNRATLTGPKSVAIVTSVTSGGPLGCGVDVPLELVRFNSGKALTTALSSLLLTLATASAASCLRSASKVLASAAEILAKVVVAVSVLLVVLIEDEDELVDVVVMPVAVELVRVSDVDEVVKVVDVVEEIVVLLLVADVDEVVLVVDVLVEVLEVVLEVVVDEVVVVVDVLVEELVDAVLVDAVLVLLLVVVVDESVTVVDVVVEVLVVVLVVVVDDTVAVVEVLVDVLVDDVLVLLPVVVVLLLVVEVDVVEDVLVEDVLELLTVAVVNEVVMLVTVPVEVIVEVGNENLAATMSYIPR